MLHGVFVKFLVVGQVCDFWLAWVREWLVEGVSVGTRLRQLGARVVTWRGRGVG